VLTVGWCWQSIVVMVQGGEVFSATKVIFITWVGTKCKPMLKAKSSQHRLPIYKYALVRIGLPRPPPTTTPHYCVWADSLC
jgi:hypothetical protein